MSKTSDLLRAIHDALMDTADTVDGADGTPRPNDAMTLLTAFGDRIEAAIAAEEQQAADLKRFAWLLSGNEYFMEEEGLCGPWQDPNDGGEKARARARIDEVMQMEEKGT